MCLSSACGRTLLVSAKGSFFCCCSFVFSISFFYYYFGLRYDFFKVMVFQLLFDFGWPVWPIQPTNKQTLIPHPNKLSVEKKYMNKHTITIVSSHNFFFFYLWIFNKINKIWLPFILWFIFNISQFEVRKTEYPQPKKKMERKKYTHILLIQLKGVEHFSKQRTTDLLFFLTSQSV